MGELIFGGISSKEIGLEVEHFPDFEIPERDYTVTHVPGRNGDVIWDNGSYKNVSRKYDISIGRFGMGDTEISAVRFSNPEGKQYTLSEGEEWFSINDILQGLPYSADSIRIKWSREDVDTRVRIRLNENNTLVYDLNTDDELSGTATIDVSSITVNKIEFDGDSLSAEDKWIKLFSVETTEILPKQNYEQMAVRVLNWLHQGSGYLRLEDSYEPSYYRLASYKENANLTNILAQGGQATITFDCKPQRFLKEETQWIVSTARCGLGIVKAFEEQTYKFSPFMRIEIFPVPDQTDTEYAAIEQPDQVWAGIYLESEGASIGTIKFLNIDSHIGRNLSMDDTLVIDIDFMYGTCLGIYKWSNDVLVPYTQYSRTNISFPVAMIDTVMANKKMYYDASGWKDNDEIYQLGDYIIKMSYDMRRYLI